MTTYTHRHTSICIPHSSSGNDIKEKQLFSFIFVTSISLRVKVSFSVFFFFTLSAFPRTTSYIKEQNMVK